MKIAILQSELQRLAALYGGPTSKRVEAIATELRNAGLLPKGGRGPYAPVANPDEISMLLLAVAGSDRVADAPKIAKVFARCVDANGKSLLSLISDALRNESGAPAIRHIRVQAFTPMAEVTFRGQSGRCEYFFSPELWTEPQFAPESQGQGYVGPIGHIGGAVIAQIVTTMQCDDDDAGEIVPE